MIVYDHGQAVLEFDKTTFGSLAAGDLGHRYLWNPAAVDQLLAEEHIEDLVYGIGNDLLWAMTDNLGSVRDLVDSDGRIRVHRNFDDFGNIVTEDHYDESGDPLAPGWFGYETLAIGYTGKAFDETTDLQNNLNRWYDPTIGRWMSEDPIGFAAGDTNLYRYVGNSPTNWVDPSGFEIKTIDPGPSNPPASSGGVVIPGTPQTPPSYPPNYDSIIGVHSDPYEHYIFPGQSPGPKKNHVPADNPAPVKPSKPEKPTKPSADDNGKSCPIPRIPPFWIWPLHPVILPPFPNPSVTPQPDPTKPPKK